MRFLLALAALAAPAAADTGDRPGGRPDGHRPPPGECRTWVPGVPPGEQPPPESCGLDEDVIGPGLAERDLRRGEERLIREHFRREFERRVRERERLEGDRGDD